MSALGMPFLGYRKLKTTEQGVAGLTAAPCSCIVRKTRKVGKLFEKDFLPWTTMKTE